MDTSTIKPVDDGITHINVYSKAHTELGKLLTNFANSPFTHTKHGNFKSVEGYWYWRGLKNILSEEQLNPLREKIGFKAKELGKELRKDIAEQPIDPEFKEDVLEAIRCKLRQNKSILGLLVKSELPLVHYYYYGKPENPKMTFLPQYDWMIDEISRIRLVTQNHLKNKKSKLTM